MSGTGGGSGRLPESVYWRRRILLLALLLAVIVVVVLVIVRPGSGSKTAATVSPKPSGASSAAATLPAATASGATPTKPSAASAGTCKTKNIKLTPVTDALNYAAGVNPQISMTIENTGTASCTIDAGTAAQEYVISSGADRIWDSKDCQQQAATNVVTLEPGKPVSTTPFAWDRTRSSTTTCTATRAPAVAGGASYHLQVKLGSLESTTTKQFVLK